MAVVKIPESKLNPQSEDYSEQLFGLSARAKINGNESYYDDVSKMTCFEVDNHSIDLYIAGFILSQGGDLAEYSIHCKKGTIDGEFFEREYNGDTYIEILGESLLPLAELVGAEAYSYQSTGGYIGTVMGDKERDAFTSA